MNRPYSLSLQPQKWVQVGLRALPHPLTRALIVADLALGTIIPFWGWWLYRRWTRKRIGLRSYWPIYNRSLKFTWRHLRRGPSHTGMWTTDWRSPPLRQTRARERADYFPRGSCGTCSKCCRTSWLPPAKQVACPFLGDDGCTIYAGLYWDYFNCGRYPTGEPELRVYACPRFTVSGPDEA